MKTLLAAIGLALAQASAQSQVLYDLDFTPTEVGSYTTVFGAPSIQHTVGPLTDALLFHAVVGYDQILLPISVAAPQYQISYDVFVHGLVNSKYDFLSLVDTTCAHGRS